ncbi:MAG: hypothetical protein DRR42_28300, partial [Gammaproteobacteria bacterium]
MPLKRWMKRAVLIFGLIGLGTWLGCGSKIELKPTADADSPTGVLIPTDLTAAHEELDAMLPSRTKKRFKRDLDFASEVHHSLGMWIRNNWGLWSDSALALWFNSHGITHPDYMSSAILESYSSYLNGGREFESIIEVRRKRDVRHRVSGRASKMLEDKFKQEHGDSDPASSYHYSGSEVCD